jgi:flagellar assembly protein FliH
MSLQRLDFQHLRDFRQPIAVNTRALEPAAETPPPPPPPPTFGEAELEQAKQAAKKLGYAEGFEAGLKQASTESEAREKDIAAALTRLREQSEQLYATYDKLIAEQSAELSEMVLAIARKVAGEALDARGMDTIVALVGRCLPVMFAKPKIVIELNPESIEAGRDRIVSHLEQHGFEGEIQFRANEHMARHDARIEWGNGQATRSTEIIWAEIEALLHQMPLTPQLPQPTSPTMGDNNG